MNMMAGPQIYRARFEHFVLEEKKKGDHNDFNFGIDS